MIVRMAEAMMDKLEELGVGSWVVVNSRVVRGIDWSGGNADGHQGGSGEGVVTKVDGKTGVVSVRWDNDNYGYYRMGAGGKFELKKAPPPPYKPDIRRRRSRADSDNKEETSGDAERRKSNADVCISEEEWEYETDSECEESVGDDDGKKRGDVSETSKTVSQPQTPPPVFVGKLCEICSQPWTENCLSATMCVECTGKMWRGEIVNKKNEFEKYDKIAFIRS